MDMRKKETAICSLDGTLAVDHCPDYVAKFASHDCRGCEKVEFWTEHYKDKSCEIGTVHSWTQVAKWYYHDKNGYYYFKSDLLGSTLAPQSNEILWDSKSQLSTAQKVVVILAWVYEYEQEQKGGN